MADEYWAPNSLEEAMWFSDSINQDEKFWSHGQELASMVLDYARSSFDTLEDKTVVDFGCGVGRVLLPMIGEFGEVVGIDFSQEMLDIAEEVLEEGVDIEALDPDERETKVTLKRNSTSPFPMSSYSCHMICSFYTLQHMDVPDVIETLGRMYDALRSDGRVFLQFSGNGDQYSTRARVDRSRTPVRKTIAYTPRIIRGLAEDAGFLDQGIEIREYTRPGDDYIYYLLLGHRVPMRGRG